MTPQRANILNEIDAERERQDAKFGEQNLRSHAGMIGPGDIIRYRIPSAEDCREICSHRKQAGIVSWLDVALEELAEVNEASLDAVNPYSTGTEAEVREELIQLAAVCVAWVECIDRRLPTTEETPTP
jgi:hypothetical protein